MASDEPSASLGEPHLSPQEAEQLDRILSDFKRSLQLPQGDPGRALADQSMRRIGFSVPQIIALSGEHHLAESTVKNHVKGMTAAADAPAQRAVQFITTALDGMVTLQSIRDFIEVKLVADATNVTMKDVIDLLRALNSQKIPYNDFINDYKQMKELGLTPANFKSAIDYKTALEKTGFGLNQLKLVHDTSEQYGDPEEILKTIGTYGDLQAIQTRIRQASIEETRVTDQLAADRNERTTLEKEKKNLSDQIESHKLILANVKRITDMGYNDKILSDFATSSLRLGGVQKVVDSLSKLHDVNELDQSILKLGNAKTKLEQEKTAMETRNAHIKAHIDATTKLIEEHNLGLDAISALLRIATKYGSAPQVLKAFEAYDSLEQLKTASEKTEDEIRRAKASLKELTEQEEALRNKVGELLPKIDADVKQWTNDLTEKLNEVTKSATAALASQNETFKKESDHTIKDINGLKAKLDGDFKTIKENAEAEVKSITELMKSDVNGSKKDFIDAFDQTKQSILDQIKRLIAASQELDKAYKARQEDLPKVQAIVQLIDLISDPRAVTDIRFLGTVHLLLKRSADWIRMNDSRFKFYPTSYDLTTSMNNLDEMLKRLNLEPPAPS